MIKQGFTIFSLLAVLAHFVFAVVIDCNSWGFNFVRYFPTGWVIAFYGIAIATCFQWGRNA